MESLAALVLMRVGGVIILFVKFGGRLVYLGTCIICACNASSTCMFLIEIWLINLDK